MWQNHTEELFFISPFKVLYLHPQSSSLTISGPSLPEFRGQAMSNPRASWILTHHISTSQFWELWLLAFLSPTSRFQLKVLTIQSSNSWSSSSLVSTFTRLKPSTPRSVSYRLRLEAAPADLTLQPSSLLSPKLSCPLSLGHEQTHRCGQAKHPSPVWRPGMAPPRNVAASPRTPDAERRQIGFLERGKITLVGSVTSGGLQHLALSLGRTPMSPY